MDPIADRAAREQFRALVAEVTDPVLRYLWRRTDATTADEVLAETLVVLWRRADRRPDEAVPWAIGIARHVLANSRRSAARRDRLVARIAAVDPPRETAEASEGREELVRRILSGMRPADAELLRLWSWEGLEPRELAVVLGISANAAAVRLHRARRRFEEAFGKDRDAAGQVVVTEGETR